MIAEFRDIVVTAFGLGVDPKEMSFGVMSLRAVVVFLSALVMVRMGDKRFFARKTAFDIILGFVLASMLARAINGSAPLAQSIVAGFVLVFLHRLLGYLARQWDWLGSLIKGNADQVIARGEIIRDSLRKNHLSERDLIEDLRLNGGVDAPAQVEAAWMERNGDVSVLKRTA